ncbi:MAG TPA: hypothetical protein VLL08_02600 [Kineosporiaceae bacterium]|nr:hypothetical protein [Kineosporiaceae bacterium]
MQFVDADGQPCLLFWIREIADPDGAWTGALSLPYRLSLDSAAADPLRLAPHPTVPPPGTDDPRTGVRHITLADGDAAHLTPTGPPHLAVDVRYERGTVIVTSNGTQTRVSDVPGPVHVLVDGPIVEVCTGTALVGLTTNG